MSKRTRWAPATVRFWSRVTEGPDDCWLWTAAKTPEGYGRFQDNHHDGYAHRWAYEYMRAPIPEGLHIDHLCRNRSCVNPWHLEPVTVQINILRGESPGAIARRRTHCQEGHDYAVHGVMHQGRRRCRKCSTAKRRVRQERQKAAVAS